MLLCSPQRNPEPPQVPLAKESQFWSLNLATSSYLLFPHAWTPGCSQLSRIYIMLISSCSLYDVWHPTWICWRYWVGVICEIGASSAYTSGIETTWYTKNAPDKPKIAVRVCPLCWGKGFCRPRRRWWEVVDTMRVLTMVRNAVFNISLNMNIRREKCNLSDGRSSHMY